MSDIRSQPTTIVFLGSSGQVADFMTPGSSTEYICKFCGGMIALDKMTNIIACSECQEYKGVLLSSRGSSDLDDIINRKPSTGNEPSS